MIEKSGESFDATKVFMAEPLPEVGGIGLRYFSFRKRVVDVFFLLLYSL